MANTYIKSPSAKMPRPQKTPSTKNLITPPVPPVKDKKNKYGNKVKVQ